MAIAFVRGGATGSVGTSTTPAHTLAATPTAGDLLVAAVGNPAAQALTAINGYTKLTENSGRAILWKRAGASEPAAQAPCTLAGAAKWVCCACEYSGFTATTGVDVETITAIATSTSFLSDYVDPTVGDNRLIIGAAFGTGTNLFSAEKLNGSTSGVIERAEAVSSGSGGTNTAVAIWDKIATSITGGGHNVEATCAIAESGAVAIAFFMAQGDPFPVVWVPSRRQRIFRRRAA